MDLKKSIKAELEESSSLLDKVLKDEQLLEAIEAAAKLLSKAFKNDGKVISCGNGGSHCDAMHFAEELTGRFREDRSPLPAICISDPSHISCVANDFGFEKVFSRYIDALGNKGDVLLAISTSGNSPNVIEAVKTAKANGMSSILLTGMTAGQLAGMADIEIRVPHEGYADRIQEIHIKVIHILILLTEQLS